VSGNVNLGWTLFQRPQITAQPAHRTVTNGNTATFNVSATGAGGFGFQWRFNGANMPNQTNTSLTLSGATPANEGSYTVVITNFAGAVTSVVANLTVLVPPTITVQPVSLIVTNPNSATFSVTAAGTDPLRYQWRWNGSILPGETNSVLVIPSAIILVRSGFYDVFVSNAAGSLMSGTVTLTVLSPANILSQPANLIVQGGSNATFSVSAASSLPSLPMIYQWLFNGANLLGETNSSLTITNAALNNQGGYSVLIANKGGAITSAVASLTVLLPLELRDTTQTVSGVRFTVVCSSNLNFTVQASADLLIWLPVLTTNSPTGFYDFTDPGAGGFSNRFYRALHDL
jgi:hypothetical protein